MSKLTKTLRKFCTVTITSSCVFFQIEQVFAATSTINNNMRIWEDATWLVAFVLMTSAGLIMRNSEGKNVALAYTIFAVAGLSGSLWKGIGLVKRVLDIDEPRWFFLVVRETFEGLTGVFIAIAFLLIVIAVRKLYD